MPSSTTDRAIDHINQAAMSAPANVVEAAARFLEVASENKQKAGAVSRILMAVTNLTEDTATQVLTDASGSSSDLGVLLDVLQQPEVLAVLRKQDPLIPARLKGLRVRERLLAAEGGVCTAKEAAAALGMTRQSIDNRRKKGKLIGVNLGHRGYAYPVWQFTEDGVLSGLDDVLSVLNRMTSWGQLIFMLNENAWLDGKRPLDELREGNVKRVKHAARMHGEQAAV